MSGTIASRFQGRFGYQPSLRTGLYRSSPAGGSQQLPGLDTTGTNPNPAPAPTPPTTPPVSAGSQPMTAEPRDASGPEGGANTYGDFGPNPGSLGAGLSGFGVSNYGTAGSVLGGLASLAGVPGASVLGGAIGTYADVNTLNGQLSSLGLAPDIGWGAAALSNATYGLAGRSAAEQFGGILGFDALAEAPLSAFQEATAAPGFGAEVAEGSLSGGMDGGNKADTVGDIGAGFGGGDFGDKGDAGSASASASDASEGPGGGGDKGDPFMRGGYTGAGADGVVQPHMPAGTVHEGELIIPAHLVQRFGLPSLMALLDEGAPRSRLMALAR